MNRYSSLLFALALAVPGIVQAAESGALRGSVTDENGLAIPDATITLSGPSLAGELQVKSDDNGNFRFLQIPPGSHTLTVVKQGIGTAKLKVTIRLDETAFAPVVLKVGSTGEVIVEEKLPVIDTTRSAISTQLSYESLEALPTGRSYQDVVNMLPGVSGRVDTQEGGPGGGNPSVRGEGQYGNNFLMDGISTRDPATKTFGTDINFDVIEEMQVYTDGAPAEYGQATGMLVNVVTKDGGDEHHGTVAYYLGSSASWGTYDILDYELHENVPTTKRQFLSHEVSLVATGPIVKEKLWYMASGSFSTSALKFEGAEKDADPQKDTGFGGFAKVSWFPTPALKIRGQFNAQQQGVNNYQDGSQYTADAQSKYRSGDMSGTLLVEARPSELSVLEGRFIYWKSYINVTPMSDDEDTPAIYNLDTGQYTGNYTEFDYNKRGRVGGTLSWSQLVNNFAGDHKFKLGAEFFVTRDSRQLVYTGPGEGFQYDAQESAGYACTPPDYLDCASYTEYVDVGALGHRANIWSGYLQDDWTLANIITANIGVRADREQLYQNAGELIVDHTMLSPRLGASWDITQDSKTALTVNAGRYYDIAGNTFADWGDSRSAFVFNQYANNGDGTYTLVWSQDPSANPLIYCNEQSLDALQASDPDTYQAIMDSKLCDQDGNGKWDLKPYHMDKLVLGFKREIVPGFAMGIRGIMSETVNVPEDVDFDLDYWVITSPEQKRRDYRALELTAERKFDEHWQLLASYTLSEAKGHMPGQFELASGGQTGSDGDQVGVYLDDVADKDTRTMFFDAGYGWLLDGLAGLGTPDNDAGYYGYLPYHSFHSVKVNGSYTFNFGTSLGLIYEFDSGHAWQKRGYVDLYQDYFAFPEGRGSRFMPATHYVDLHVGHRVDFDELRSLGVSLDVFNLFDFHAPVTYYENDDENFGLVLFRQAPRSVRVGLDFKY